MRIPKSNSDAEHRKTIPKQVFPDDPTPTKMGLGVSNRKMTPILVKSSWIFTYKTKASAN